MNMDLCVGRWMDGGWVCGRVGGGWKGVCMGVCEGV